MAPRTISKPMNFKRYSIIYTLLTVCAIGVIVGVIMYSYHPVSFRVYSDPETGVSIKYPSSWGVRDKEQLAAPGALVAFSAPATEEKRRINPNVSVTYADLNKKTSLSLLKQQTMIQMAALFKGNIKILEDEQILLADRSGYKIVFVGQGIETPLQYLLVWTLAGDRAYMVTYINLAANFNEHMPLVNAMIKSFKIK